jgi:hypothetical protein
MFGGECDLIIGVHKHPFRLTPKRRGPSRARCQRMSEAEQVAGFFAPHSSQNEASAGLS